jgi:hypothetical protein
MTQTVTTTRTTDLAPRGPRAKWPLIASAAGVLGIIGTMVTDGRKEYEVTFSHQLFVDLDPMTYRASLVTGYLAVVLLIVLAAVWRRRVEPRLPNSTAAHVVPMGLISAAAGLTYGYGWKGAMGLYMPGGNEDKAFDDTGLAIYYVLTDFGAWIGWLGVVVAAGAVAWMALKERSIARWIGAFSVLPVLQTTLMVVGLGIPGVPALLGPLWLVVTGLGLYFSKKTTITR